MNMRFYAIALLILWAVGGCTDAKQGSKMIKTPSGLQYRIEKEASAGAAVAQKGRPVTVHYTGWLEKKGAPGEPDMARKFDSSKDRNQPFQFVLGGGMVIQGWDEGVQGMKVGEIRRLVIPAILGYGSRGAGPIPGGATLIFDVELLKI